MDANEFCCWAHVSVERLNDFRTRCDFTVAFKPAILFARSSNHDIGGFGNDWADGDSKHLLPAKNEKFGGELEPPLRCLPVPFAFRPPTLEAWFLFGVLMLIDFDGDGRWDPLEDFLLLGLPLTKVRSLDGECLLLVPIFSFLRHTLRLMMKLALKNTSSVR